MKISLVLGILLGLSLEQAAAAEEVDVRGHVFCYRGRQLEHAEGVLVVYDLSRQTTSSDMGEYLLHLRTREIADRTLTLRFVGRNGDKRGESQTFALGEPGLLNGRSTVFLFEHYLRGVTCDEIDPSVARLSKDNFAGADIHYPLQWSLHNVRVAAMAALGTTVDPFNAWEYAPQVGLAKDWFSPASSVFAGAAVGTRLLLGGVFGQYQAPGPFTQGSPKNGKGLLPFRGGLAEFDFELHAARAAMLSYVVGLGVRAGISHRDDMSSEADKPFWGPVLSGRVLWPWSDRISGVLQLHLSWQLTPYAMNPRNCVGPSIPMQSQWDAWGGIALGVEVRP